jgi:hypothetical protein
MPARYYSKPTVGLAVDLRNGRHFNKLSRVLGKIEKYEQ